jgi:hypothetical protein
LLHRREKLAKALHHLLHGRERRDETRGDYALVVRVVLSDPGI